MQLVGASQVPKLKLPRPRASRVITWKPVDALTALSVGGSLSGRIPVLASVLAGARGV